MIWPLQMMLFGCRRASYDALTSMLTLDGWARFEMDYREATDVLALRPLIENLVMRLAEEPQISSTTVTPLDIELRDVLLALSSPRANEACYVAGALAEPSASDVLGIDRELDAPSSFAPWQQASPFQAGPFFQRPPQPLFGPPGAPFRQPFGRYKTRFV